MNLEWLDDFEDHHIKTPGGKGVFLAGILLGMAAKEQSKGAEINDAPLYKQLQFGKLQKRDLKRHIARMPELMKAYDMRYRFYLRQLEKKSGELLLSDAGDMGIDGNFIFSVAFLNAGEYFWKIFKKETDQENTDTAKSGEEE